MKLKSKITLNLLLILILLLVASCGANNIGEYYIFSDINECLNFETADENIKIEKYDSTEKDENIKDLEYDGFYAAQIESSDCQFEIFAYEFKNDNASKSYFKSVSGRTCDGESAFFGSGGITSYTLVVVDSNRAYKINTTSNEIEKVNDLLANTFSNKLNFINDAE